MSDLAMGSTIAGCRLEAVAGRGGMGVVWRATQLALDRTVAVKAMAPELAADAEFRERFQRESHLAASIEHPNVIPVYEAGELDGTLYLIMRWVDGTDLRELLVSTGGLPPKRALRLLAPVALALAAAHRRGLVHRDIKPANVLIARGDEEHVYLTDFGIARLQSGEGGMTRTGVLVGTLDYTAPERFEGAKGDAQSDIYAFGCMLYQTLTGKIPYDRPSDVSKMFAHINDPVPSAAEVVRGVPPSIDAIIARAMAKRPEDRFGSAAELADALSAVLAEMSTTEVPTRLRARTTKVAATAPSKPPAASTVIDDRPPTTATVPGPRSPGRSRLPLVGGGVLLVLVGAIVAVVIAASGGGSKPPATTPVTPTTPVAPTAAEASVTSGAGITIKPDIPLPGTPAAIGAGDRFVWVSLPDSQKLFRVSQLTRDSLPFTVEGQPNAITSASGGRGIWVAETHFGPLALLGFDRPTLIRNTRLTQTPSLLAADPNDGTAWASDTAGHVSHVALDGTVLAQTTVSPPPQGIGAGEPDWGWAVNGAKLVRIDPHTGTQASFDIGPGPVSVTFDTGVWVARSDGHVVRFNPRTLKPSTEVMAPASLDQIAAREGAQSVWAISTGATTLYRISNTTPAKVTGTVKFRSQPVAIVITQGGVWVATQDHTLVQLKG